VSTQLTIIVKNFAMPTVQSMQCTVCKDHSDKSLFYIQFSHQFSLEAKFTVSLFLFLFFYWENVVFFLFLFWYDFYNICNKIATQM